MTDSDVTNTTMTVLKRDALGRVQRTVAQREAVLDEWERSGLSGTAFARISGIHYQTLATWRQQRRRKRGEVRTGTRGRMPSRSASSPQGLRLVEVAAATAETAISVLPSTTVGGNDSGVLEVALPGGAVARMINPQQALLLAELLKALA